MGFGSLEREHQRLSCVSEFLTAQGAPAAEATFTHWLRLDEATLSISTSRLQCAHQCDYDYGLMSEWVDTKLAQAAERVLGESAAERLRAQKVRRALGGHYAPASDGESAVDGEVTPAAAANHAARGRRLSGVASCSCRSGGGGGGSSSSSGLAPSSEGSVVAHLLPKLLCGLYGGCFEGWVVPQSMGVGPYLTIGCVLDGTTRYTVNNDMDW